MCRDASHRVAHIVQAVEESSQVVPHRRGSARRGLEAHPLGPRPPRRLAFFVELPRTIMVVRAGEHTRLPGRPPASSTVEAPRPQPTSATRAPPAGAWRPRRRARAASPVPGEPRSRSRKLLATQDDVGVLLVPAQSGAGPERLSDRRDRGQRAKSEGECAGDIPPARCRVRQSEGLLGGQRVATGLGVVADVPAGRLSGQPLTHVAGVGGRCAPPVPAPVAGPSAASARYRPQPVADDDIPGRDRRAQVTPRTCAQNP